MKSLFQLLALLTCLAGHLRADDFDTVEARVVETLLDTAPSAASVENLRSALQPNGAWPDVIYTSTAQTGWTPLNHLNRLRDLAKAYKNPGGAHFQDPALLAQILAAYDFWISSDPQSTNWWYPQIGAPLALGDAMVLMKPELSPARLTSGAALLARAYVPRSTNSGTNTGANRTDRAYASLKRGLMIEDAALVSESFLAIGDTILVATAEGIQPDYSFHQHGPQLYVQGYGSGYASSTLLYVYLAHDTAFSYTARQVRTLVDYLLDGIQWFTRGNSVDPTASGRNVTRKGAAANALGSLTQIARALQVNAGYRSPELLAYQQRMTAVQAAGTANPALALSGNRNFWRSDAMTHHRPAFLAVVKTSSTRTYQPESGNGEGLKSLHLADGATLIHRTGNEYDDIVPFWDWRRLPGTTTEQGTYSLKPSPDWGAAGTSTHAGGVSDGLWGSVAFDHARRNVAVKKSWFFFDGEFVALGAAINAPSATANVLTTVNQSHLNGGVTYRTGSGAAVTLPAGGTANSTDPKWAHHDQTGYFFPAGGSMGIRAVTQSGTWQSINTTYDATAVSGPVFSLDLSHGTAVANGSYAYVVAPGMALAAMDDYLATMPVTIVRNDATAQAVRHPASHRLAANFWAAGTAGEIQVNQKCCALLENDGNYLALTISDPTQTQTADLVVDMPIAAAGTLASDTGVTVEQTAPTLRVRFAVAGSQGRPIRAKFFLKEHAVEILNLEPAADAYVQDGNPDQNYGGSTSLALKWSPAANLNRDSFLKFDLSEITRAPISAALELQPTTAQSPGYHQLLPVDDDSWTESGITWSNRPSPFSAAAAIWTPKVGVRVGIDLTAPAAAALSGDRVLSMLVTPFTRVSDGYVAYPSREHATPEMRPRLRVAIARTALEIWRIHRFGPNANDPAVSGNARDPDGDGVPNLLEFALGRNPGIHEGGLPAGREGDFLTLAYSPDPAATGVSVFAEWSDNLMDWHPEGFLLEQSQANILARLPLGGATAKFIRLRAELLPAP